MYLPTNDSSNTVLTPEVLWLITESVEPNKPATVTVSQFSLLQGIGDDCSHSSPIYTGKLIQIGIWINANPEKCKCAYPDVNLA